MLVMTIVIAKYIWRALQPDRRDPEEGLQPWENPDFYDDDYDNDRDPDNDNDNDRHEN